MEIHPCRITENLEVVPQQTGKMLLIAGPCQIESREHSLKIADFLRELVEPFAVNLIFKSSFDKANRTSVEGERGVGLDEGLRILEEVRSATNLPVITDVHLPAQVRACAEVVDVLQIPAFLCRQTDLLIEAGASGKAVMLKKGQFLPPADVKFCIEKIRHGGGENVMLCERGTTFGYRDLIVDPRSFVIMAKQGCPVVFDATHSVQSLGGAKGKSGGARRFVAPLARAAVAVGIDGLFIECHDNPAAAPSDGPCMLPLEELEPLLSSICRIREALAQ